MTPSSFRALALLVLPTLLGAAEPAIRGYDSESARRQSALEDEIRKTPQPSNIREYIRVMSEEPHHTGSEGGRQVAAYVLGKFREWGLEAEYHEFDGLMPTPKHRRLELLEPESYTAALEEPALPEDKDSTDGGLATYNAYSADGNATAQAVYVNYGMPPDYEALDELGISVAGKIVLARYGGGWRGLKPKLAAERGAIGCLIYSDPEDDGFYRGDVYPDGPFRPQWGVQRGSTKNEPPGDPLTPGWPSAPGERRLAISEAESLPTIPTQPIAWGDALPILRNLGGPVAPESWRGGLPLTYHVGPGPAKVRLEVASNWDRPTGRNVIARIEGAEFPDEWVIYGNHHDAWVNGATDPVSGNAALLETARTIAEMVRQGWRPKRTILFASWDAEEWGLIGSTEWVELHAAELTDKAVIYFNTDSNTQGTLAMSGSHILERFLNETARAVQDPRTEKSLWEEMRAKTLDNAADEERERIESRSDLRINALGSGSDYGPFLDHLAIPSTNVSFRGEGGGVYHSKYDSFDWYRRFGDPEFLYGRALAEFHAIAIARIADAPILPYEFTNFADTIRVYLDEIEELDTDKKVPLAGVRSAWDELSAAADDYESAYREAAAEGFDGDRRAVNQALILVERAMAHPDGLPDRSWYRHMIYAPGVYTGYGVKTLPGVREAVEEELFERASEQADRLAEILRGVAERIEEAAERLSAS